MSQIKCGEYTSITNYVRANTYATTRMYVYCGVCKVCEESRANKTYVPSVTRILYFQYPELPRRPHIR
jgi:hypothetical protein